MGYCNVCYLCPRPRLQCLDDPSPLFPIHVATFLKTNHPNVVVQVLYPRAGTIGRWLPLRKALELTTTLTSLRYFYDAKVVRTTALKNDLIYFLETYFYFEPSFTLCG